MVLLFSHFSNAQTNYETDWQKVQTHENKGLPKSALAVVETIYSKAKMSNNSAQIIKAILYRSKYALTLEEDAQLKIIKTIKSEIAISKTPEKNILESILANLYWQYFQQNRYKFYQRSHIDEVNETEISTVDDFRTWDLHTIFKEIHKHHQNALNETLLLQQSDLSQFNAILHGQEKSKNNSLTVYDFITHNALNFYKTGESNLAQPSYKFEIDNPEYLGDNVQFLMASLDSEDVFSQKREALNIYKNLTLFHKNDQDKSTLIALTLQRLDFVNQHAKFTNKARIFYDTLKSLQTTYRDDEASTEIDYRIALYHKTEALKYQSNKNKDAQFKNKDALNACNKAISLFPKSIGAIKCKNLKNEILQATVHLKIENNVVVNKESRALITYKNTTKLYFKIYKSAREFETELNKIYNQKEKLVKITNHVAIKDFTSTLKTEQDYQNHTTEIIIPKLPQGNYLILASSDPNFTDDKSFSYGFIQATNIVLIEVDNIENRKFQVVDRFSGKPYSNAKLHLKNYTTNNNRYNKKIDRTLTTDSDGFVNFKVSESYNRVEIEVTHKDDKGIFKYYNFYKQHVPINYQKTANNTIFLFTDRSIYRPSQVVYFKGVAVEQKENKSHVIANKMMTVLLKDTNYQIVKEMNLKTNEFGSFSGEFILPNTGLNGRFQIQVATKGSETDHLSSRERIYGDVNFKVEEYKRPKFSAKFNKITDTFRLNETIAVKGQAMAYAGSTISDAKVVYRVKRNVQYPKWWYWYRPYQPMSEAQEITHGETKTNAKGAFVIPFLAKPDTSINKKDKPVFSYEITADITDINGETRSTTTVVKIGYHAQTLDITVDDNIDKGTKKKILKIESKNLNGEFVATKGLLKIYKINAPKNVVRNRPWSIPDYQEIPQNEFKKLFPHEVYTKTSEAQEKGELVFTTSFDTHKTKEIALPKMKSWQSGMYVAIAEASDKFKQEIADKARFSIHSDMDKKVPDNQLFDVNLDKDTYKVGDKVALKIGSASKDLTVVIAIEKNQKVIETKIIHLSNEIKTICLPVNKEDIGGFGISYHLVNYNAFLSGNLLVKVPFPKADLDIETLTFRDKLQPGTDETWRFKIKGHKKDKAVAEILTSMYDASLDQFTKHQWVFKPINFQNYYVRTHSSARNSFGVNQFRSFQKRVDYLNVSSHQFPNLNWFGLHFGYGNWIMSMSYADGVGSDKRAMMKSAPSPVAEMAMAPAEGSSSGMQDAEFDSAVDDSSNSSESTDFSAVKIRSNFKETAFFFPHLKTDKDGNVSFSFTTPESLTKWKLQVLAHTKNMHSAVKSLETVTQKELMVIPNPPRFLRQGDDIVISSKIANLTDKTLTGQAELQLIDAITNKKIDVELGNQEKTKTFNVDANGNTNVSWTLHIPENTQSVQYKIIAKAGDFSDGEQNVLPVLSNRMLVTETMPMWIKSGETKTFRLDKLADTKSSTIANHKLTLEVTSNPAWYAVQALPYLMEYPYECAEQTFSRYYANTLASYIVNSNPRIQDVFNQWKSSDALLSNLEKNQELKSLIIQETPWLRDAQSETEQKKRIALLFDLNKMKNEQENTVNKLKQMQMSSGGFPWFKGSRYENRYITQHIVAGFGHLDKLGVFENQDARIETQDMLEKAVKYLDRQILKDYNKLLNNASKNITNEVNKEQKTKDYLAKNHTSHFQVHYLYTRSFFNNPIDDKVQVAVDYYKNQTYQFWNSYNLYSKGLIALVAHRDDQNTTAQSVLQSLKENAITSDELGMYWKSNTSSYYWYQAPIETQALMIEVFSELKSIDSTLRQNDIDQLKIWLLKNKQTNRWKTTKATSEAVYALLIEGTSWLNTTKFVDVIIGNQNIKPLEIEDTKVEAGTGYFKTSWNGTEVIPQMAEVTIKKEGDGIAWGALYWQYFEDLDKITFAETPLQLSKKLYLKTNEDRGEKITLITNDTKLVLGDLVRVRIELKVDRAMEFVHMKDMRAAGFEPVNVLSRYKWQDGLGYYESTKDASTNFFFDRLPKGVYVFEYDLRVNNSGNFSNGITTIQSMYAPEFTSHSEGVRVKVGE